MNSGIEMNHPNHNRDLELDQAHLFDEIVYDVEVVGEYASHVKSDVGQPPESKSWIERVLSPQSLQIMMAAGGGVLVIGIAIWLFSIGIFDNPLVGATAMGIGNLGLLGCGLWLLKSTRYKTAGRGLTLLGSLLLPLHLWFYDAQNLISIDDGGHLWIPALLISGLYALIARVTRDSMFVYTLVGGIVLTGLLFLANPAIGALWAILPTSAFLIALGVICTFADRFFTEEQGAFSRSEFGLAFFRAGQAVVVFGLTTLGVGQLMQMDSDLITTTGQLLSIGALVLAAYNCVYSHIVRPQGFVFPLMIIGIAGWASLIGLNVLAIKITINLFLLAIAIGLVGVNAWYHRIIAQTEGKKLSWADQQIVRVVIPVITGLLFAASIAQFFGGLYHSASWFNNTLIWQLVATGVALWATPGTWGWNETDEIDRSVYGVNLACGSVMLTMGLMVLVFPNAIGAMCAALALPTILLGFSIAAKESKLAKRMAVSGACSTFVVAIVSLMLMEKGLIAFEGWPGIALMTVSTGYLAFVARMMRSWSATLAAIATGVVCAVQLIVMFELTSAFTLIIAVSCLGMLLFAFARIPELVAANRVAADTAIPTVNPTIEKKVGTQPKLSILTLANVALLAGAGGAVFFVCSTLMTSSITFAHVGLLAFQAVPIFLGWAGNKDMAWKKTFITAGMATLITGAIAMVSISTLSLLQRAELVSLIVGAGLVVFGYVGWSMEDEKKADLVTFQLVLGSLLLAVPMIIGLLAYRVVGIETVNLVWRQLHEIGGLVIGMSLLGTGVLSRIRSTTITGAAVLLTYIVSILFLIQWPAQLQKVSVLMMVGGGAFFTVAILLSFYRDRLLALPERVRNGRGLFRVLKWR
jgi:hypothetical protein